MKAPRRLCDRIAIVVMLLLPLSLASCGRVELSLEGTATPDGVDVGRATFATDRTATPETPVSAPSGAGPTPTSVLDGSDLSHHDPALAEKLSGLVEPLLIDGEKGWVFASAQMDGQPRTVKLATQDGRLLAAYEVVGKLALDRSGNRLFVDQGAHGVAILDAGTGGLQATIALPDAGPANVEPQVDPTTGLAYVFRDKTLYMIDPAAMAIKRAFTLSVASSVCGDPGEDAPIARSFYDLVNNKLYLSFVTYVCTPWVQHTVIAYDAPTLTELGIYKTERNFQAVPYSDSLHGTTAGRLGRYVSWSWNGREVWFEEADEGHVPLQGIVADWGRELIYEALDGQIRVFQAYPRELMAQIGVPLLASESHLAGHDPISDQLYFLAAGRLEIRPTTDILSPSARQVEPSTPYCRPSEAALSLRITETTPQVGQAVTVSVTLANGDASGVRLGQIQYLLRARPSSLFTLADLGPVPSSQTLEPGQLDETAFVLNAVMPGRATFTAEASYEIHDLDDSSGSWSGCRSEPAEIVVEADNGTSRVIDVYDRLYVRDGYSFPPMTIAVAAEELWIGFGNFSSRGVGGGAWRYRGDEWKVFNQAEGFPASDNVQVLRTAPDGSVWAGAGCQVARYADGRWIKLAGCETLKGNVTDIVFTPDGATWVASAMELNRFDGQTWTSFGKLANGLAVAPDGSLWVSGWEGLQSSFYVARFDGQNWTTHNVVDLLGGGVGQIAVTPDGDVWGTMGDWGIVRFDGETWRRYTDAEGLPDNYVFELLLGPNDALWAVTEKGIARFDGNAWLLQAFVPGGHTLAFDRDGTMWLGTQDGLYHVLP